MITDKEVLKLIPIFKLPSGDCHIFNYEEYEEVSPIFNLKNDCTKFARCRAKAHRSKVIVHDEQQGEMQ